MVADDLKTPIAGRHDVPDARRTRFHGHFASERCRCIRCTQEQEFFMAIMANGLNEVCRCPGVRVDDDPILFMSVNLIRTLIADHQIKTVATQVDGGTGGVRQNDGARG
jgi:hypothetical protein